MRKGVYFISRVFRRVTAPIRRLPDFIIIGTSKGGTSTLFDLLKQHPQLKLSSRKEVQYYGTHYEKGLSWYKSFFPLKFGNGKFKTGEATPYYLFYPLAPKLIKQDNAHVKLIVLLRDPIARAYSHYQMQRRNKFEDAVSFEEAIDREDQRIEGEAEKLLSNAYCSSNNHLRFAYMNRGKYGEQIERWFEHFPTNQFLFLKSEDFFSDPEEAMGLVYDFLNIEKIMPEKMSKKNVGHYKEINPQLSKKLRAYFKKDNELLINLIGNTFNYSEPESD